MIFLAEYDLTSLLGDLIFKGVVPVALAFCSTMVAIYAIDKADHRERHKRKRDGVISVAVDFISATDAYGDVYRGTFTKLLGEAATTESTDYNAAAATVQSRISAFARKLEVMNEERLGKELFDYLPNFRTNRDQYFVILCNVVGTMDQATFEQSMKLYCDHVERTRQMFERLKEEVCRLDKGETRFRDWLKKKFNA